MAKNPQHNAGVLDVSSRGVAETAIERSKDRHSGTWEGSVRREQGRIPSWDSSQDVATSETGVEKSRTSN